MLLENYISLQFRVSTSFSKLHTNFLTLASINFLDTSKVSLHEFFTFLAALNAPGPLRRGDQIWEQLCCWLKSNENTLLCDSSSIMDSTFLQDFRKVLSGNDHPSEGDGSLLHDVEVKRLVLQILALSDVRRQLLPDHEREQSTLFTSLILPLQDILCSMGSHVYLPSGKADRAIQVLSSIVNFVLEADMSFQRSCNEGVDIIAKKLCSRDIHISQETVTSLDKVHTYLDLLSAISNFVSNEAIAKSAGIHQVSQELARFKESLTKDCQKVLTSSFDTQLASSNPELCCEAITASWCCVLDSYRNKDFWELYSSFVKLAFQIELMQEGPESPIFESLNKIIEFILNKGKVKLGLVNFVITNICHTWHKMLSDKSQARNVITAASNHLHLLKKAVLFGSLRKEGRLREEMLIYLSQNTSLGALRDRLKITSYEKDPALVRVTLINLIIRLGETKLPEAEKFLVELLQSLLEEDISVTPQGKCYVINSQVHRIKQRVWQAALVIVNYLPKEPASSIFQQILLQLASENQSSAKHMMEWLVVLMTHRFPSTVNQFWARVDEMVKGSRSGFSPILIIISHLGSVQPSRDCKAIPIIFPWSMAPTSSLRVQSQVSLYKIWLDCKREGLSEVLEKFPALNASMEYNENRGSSITNKMEGNFFLRDFHPLLDYSIEDGSTSIPLFNNRDALRTAQKLGKAAEKQRFATKFSSVDLNVIDFKEKPLPLGVDVQKKITPLREELAPGFGDDSQSNTEGKRSQLVVVATLVDRLPNLGGLCRTSEIFGVEKLIIGSARYLEDKSFLGLSVTAERWLPMKEVRPSELKDYLTEMRHHGYTLVGVEQTANSVQMTEYRFPAKTVILLGNERTGIPVELIHHLDVCVEIPQLGYIRSLNVHVSGALMVWEYTKQQMLGL
ncbi:putative methyltransferase TARBP1 [Apostichopus japonicus]|uniref:tRNA (guanosine(18)-2'-O)-methyltransferase TARBP1 n=1 Tax=Stichopus japonicus TaxID=307972 RepID=A0A2G8K9L9_STIJA|nr:putative methyltransferase TARBP1 [Apostichopus japonicus]